MTIEPLEVSIDEFVPNSSQVPVEFEYQCASSESPKTSSTVMLRFGVRFIFVDSSDGYGFCCDG